MSLRVRLLLAVGAASVLALAAADVATYRSLRSFLYSRVDQSLDAVHTGLEQGPRGRPQDGHGGQGGFDGREGPPSESGVAEVGPGVFVEQRAADGSVVGTSVPARQPGGTQLSPKLPAHIGAANTYMTVPSASEGGPDFRVRVSARPNGGQLIVGVPLGDTSDTLQRLVLIELLVTFAAVAAAGAAGWWLVRLGLRPLRNVEHTAAAIAEGRLDRRVPGEDDATEVGQLARAFNRMLERIQEAFAKRDATEERLRRFVADVSHELRTPIAAVSAYAEMFSRGAASRPDDAARVISGIRSETGRMSHLVEDLLLLARLDEGQEIEHKPVELVSVAGEAVQMSRTLAPAWDVRLRAERPVEVSGDERRLRQVIDNLLANVRAHTPPGTTAQVRVSENGADAIVEVADDGPGLTPEHAGRVFERFYRADPSRVRHAGGAGLGLGIVAAIVDAHGGRVEATATPGGGATFRVRLPKAL